MPYGARAAMEKVLDKCDIENIRDREGRGDSKITREDVEDWVSVNSGDFSSILGFAASIEDGENTLDFPWIIELIELAYNDCMSDSFPGEDY